MDCCLPALGKLMENQRYHFLNQREFNFSKIKQTLTRFRILYVKFSANENEYQA